MARESSLVPNPTLDWVDDADFTSSDSDTQAHAVTSFHAIRI